VKAVNSHVFRTSHKYGIGLPTSVKHPIDIDCKNKNIFWQDALKKEMGNVCIAFEIVGHNKKAPPGWHKALKIEPLLVLISQRFPMGFMGLHFVKN
jgi:hypothetical protein